MKSGIADMVNTGGRPGGSISAALFLKQVYDFIILLSQFVPVVSLPQFDHVCVLLRHFLMITFSTMLLQFVDEKVEWMHIDMAGPVWSDKKRTATGFGVSTLVEWVLKNSAQVAEA